MTAKEKLESAQIKLKVYRRKARVLEDAAEKLWERSYEINDSLRLLKLKAKLEVDGAPIEDYRHSQWNIPAKKRLNGTYWLGYNTYSAKYNNKIIIFRTVDSSANFALKAAKAFAEDGTKLKFIRPKKAANTAFAELKNLLDKQGYTLTKK